MKNGWYKVLGYDVFLEDGFILRGILGKGNAQNPAYIYRRTKDGEWTKEERITEAAFRSGVKRGTIQLM